MVSNQLFNTIRFASCSFEKRQKTYRRFSIVNMAVLNVPAATLVLALVRICAAARYLNFTDVFVSLDGHDSKSCGTVIQPCRSIAEAIRQVAWGGRIYLDGTGTERKPYRCSLVMAHEQHPGTVVEKSFRMEGWRALPHISCFKGFHFIKKSTAMSRILAIALSGIAFRQTPLTFQDCDIITIANCSFEDTAIALYVQIDNNTRMQLNIQRSSFVKNNISCVEIVLAKNGQEQDQFLAVNISETEFLENGMHQHQFARGAVTIRSQTTLSSNILHVQVSCLNITSVNNVGYFMNLDLPSAVTSEVYNDVRLFNNTPAGLVKASTGRTTQHVVSSLYKSYTKKTHVKFSNLKCWHNHLLSCICSQSGEAEVEIQNSSFVGQHHALFIKGPVPDAFSKVYPLNVSIYNCTFLDNFRDVLVKSPNQVELVIKNTIFSSRQIISGSFGLRILVRPSQKLTFSNAVIELENVTFDSKPCNIISLLLRGQTSLQVKRSSFLNSVCLDRFGWNGSHSVFDTSAGAISVVSSSDKTLSPGCVKPGSKRDIHVTWQYEAHVRFEDTIFEGNGGLTTGAVYIRNAYTTFERCNFRNNFAIDNSGHVYSAYGTGQVDFKDCIFSSTKVNMTMNNITLHESTFLRSESGGPINLKNTTMVSFGAKRNSNPILDISNGGYVYMDYSTTIQCPIGSQLLLDNTTHFVYTEQNNSVCIINVTVLKYYCQPCYQGFYSIQKGESRGLVINNTVTCLQCPFGARCSRQRNVAAKPNFWGYPISSDPPSLRFIACPEHYCQKSTSAVDYNSCQGNRSGTLCGKCTPGYSESLFSTECRMNEKCNNYWFWILMILLTTGLALYLLLKPPILVFLGNQILWFRRKENHQGSSDSGYIKITFYFYQAAEILMVGSIESLLEKMPFIHTVIAAFNFQVRTVNKGIGCPFQGLTAVTKQFFLSGTVFVTMADVVLIYYVHSVINMFRRKKKPALIHYMAVVMEVLLLGYERLAETSLKLMQCVSIESQRWLFIDANVPCMQWWQYFLLAFIVVFVVPFVIVLYCGSSKLYRASITTHEFLAACMLPLPFLVIWFFKKILKLKGQNGTTAQAGNEDVLEVLHGPFRPPKNEDKGTLHWESVLIGRRLILLTCQSFITCPMSRMVSMAAACLLMTIHHVMKNPYREPIANKAETLSLTTLTLIAVINLTKATLLAFGITTDGPYRSYLNTLEWFEVISLAFVPLLVSVLVIFAILSQLARLVVFLSKVSFQLGSPEWPMEQRRPLLDIAV